MWPGFRLGIIGGLSLLVLYSAPKCLSPGTPVFPSHQKPTHYLICVDLTRFLYCVPCLSLSAKYTWQSKFIIIIYCDCYCLLRKLGNARNCATKQAILRNSSFPSAFPPGSFNFVGLRKTILTCSFVFQNEVVLIHPSSTNSSGILIHHFVSERDFGRDTQRVCKAERSLMSPLVGMKRRNHED